MPIRAVEISNFFFIFLFSPPYLDFPPPKPLPSTPQSFFPPFKTFFGTWKKIFFGKFSHLALFGTFWPNLPKYGLLGPKSLGFARAFTSRNEIKDFLLGTPFSYFFGTFWHFLAISPNFSPRVACDSSKWSEWVARLIFAIKSEFLWLCQTLARIWLKSDRVQKTRIWLHVVNGLLFPTVLSYHTLVLD